MRFTLYSLSDLFNQTPYQLLWEEPSHAAINARRLLVQVATTCCIFTFQIWLINDAHLDIELYIYIYIYIKFWTMLDYVNVIGAKDTFLLVYE